MSIRDIITVPDETLKKISEPIEKVGVNEKKLINDLFETMYNSNGIGLAAVQVGILKRVLVVDVSSKEEKKKPICFINPLIKKISDEMSVYEKGSHCALWFKERKFVKTIVKNILRSLLQFLKKYSCV